MSTTNQQATRRTKPKGTNTNNIIKSKKLGILERTQRHIRSSKEKQEAHKASKQTKATLSTQRWAATTMMRVPMRWINRLKFSK
jgi:hypothetical protein